MSAAYAYTRDIRPPSSGQSKFRSSINLVNTLPNGVLHSRPARMFPWPTVNYIPPQKRRWESPCESQPCPYACTPSSRRYGLIWFRQVTPSLFLDRNDRTASPDFQPANVAYAHAQGLPYFVLISKPSEAYILSQRCYTTTPSQFLTRPIGLPTNTANRPSPTA